MKKRDFTLIELLTVIVIIAILMGFLLPVLSKINEHAKITKAKTQMNSIMMAIKSYESTYGILPNLNGESADATPLSDDNNDKLMQVLAKVNMTSGGGSLYQKDIANTRAIKFIDVDAKFSTQGILDPWGKRFKVAIDFGYDNQLAFCGDPINNTVAIYSFGPNATDNSGGKSSDDIVTWR